LIAPAPRWRVACGAIATVQAVASHCALVNPCFSGTPGFWKGATVTRWRRSSAWIRRADHVQKRQEPSKISVTRGGGSPTTSSMDRSANGVMLSEAKHLGSAKAIVIWAEILR
jgi:hypothetical protein